MFEYWMKTDIAALPEVNRITGRVFTQDSRANKIGAELYRYGEPEEISGDITASIILPTGETIKEDGHKEGNRAWVILPDNAYSTPGTIRIFLKATDENGTATIGAAEGKVYESMTSEVIPQ